MAKPANSRNSAVSKVTWPADQVIRRPIEELIPYARNARLHSDAQVAQIAASIREWGWTMPVLIDESGALIAGHGRVLAARMLGIDQVPTMIAHGWSDAKVKAYRVADNQLALNATWDKEALGLELAELRDMGAAVDLIGFDAASIDSLIAGPKAPDEFGDYDESIDTEHACPRCGFRWSGASVTAKEHDDDEARP